MSSTGLTGVISWPLAIDHFHALPADHPHYPSRDAILSYIREIGTQADLARICATAPGFATSDCCDEHRTNRHNLDVLYRTFTRLWPEQAYDPSTLVNRVGTARWRQAVGLNWPDGTGLINVSGSLTHYFHVTLSVRQATASMKTAPSWGTTGDFFDLYGDFLTYQRSRQSRGDRPPVTSQYSLDGLTRRARLLVKRLAAKDLVLARQLENLPPLTQSWWTAADITYHDQAVIID